MTWRYRTICRTGKVHAEFSVSEQDTVLRRTRKVLEFDDRHRCGPHYAERTLDGEVRWQRMILGGEG